MIYKNVGIIFSGQGSQYEGMGSDLYDRKEYNLLKNIDEEIYEKVIAAKESDLDQTKIAQIAIFLHSVALYRELKSRGCDFKYFTGLSLGEYSALSAAEKINLTQSINLVINRGAIMQKAVEGKGSMLAIMKSSIDEVEDIISSVKGDEILSISNINSPAQIVVGGSYAAIDSFLEESNRRKIKRVVRLNVAGPFHTEYLKTAAEEFSNKLKDIDFEDNENIVYSNYRTYVHSRDNYIENLKRQMYSTVNFEGCIRKMISEGCDSFIEIGPGKALSGFVKKIDNSLKVYNIERINDINEIMELLERE